MNEARWGPALAGSSAGWHLVGTTDADLWDLGRAEPALLMPGTVVRFVPVDGGVEKGAAW